jgi:hypothetical protein
VGVKFEVPGLFERNADEITERWSPGPGFATAGRCPNVAFMRVGEASSAALVMTVSGAGVRNAADIERVLTEFAQEPNGGLIVTPSPLTATRRALIIDLAARLRLPTIYPPAFFFEGGPNTPVGRSSTATTASPLHLRRFLRARELMMKDDHNATNRRTPMI